ncbi:MAG: hypothetical protein AAB777_00990 [Patescibacteria group bacterium]
MLVLTLYGVPEGPPEARASFDALKHTLIEMITSFKELGLNVDDVAVHYPQNENPGNVLKCIVMCLRESPAIPALSQDQIVKELCEKIKSTLTVFVKRNHVLLRRCGEINVRVILPEK